MHLTPLKFSLILLLNLTKPTTQCLIYTATLPFSHDLPFLATLTDNNQTTCWLSQTYLSHSHQQEVYDNTGLKPSSQKSSQKPPTIPYALINPQRRKNDTKKPQLKKRSNGTKIKLTKFPSLLEQSKTNPFIQPPTNRGGGTFPPRQGVQDVYAVEEGEGKEWINWNFNCLPGYEAHVAVGLRNVFYRKGVDARGVGGRNWTFTADAKEDLWREEWRYEVKLWC